MVARNRCANKLNPFSLFHGVYAVFITFLVLYWKKMKYIYGKDTCAIAMLVCGYNKINTCAITFFYYFSAFSYTSGEVLESHQHFFKAKTPFCFYCGFFYISFFFNILQICIAAQAALYCFGIAFNNECDFGLHYMCLNKFRFLS